MLLEALVVLVPVIITLVATVGFIKYSQIRYGSETDILKLSDKLEKHSQMLSQYEKDGLHKRLCQVESRLGTGFDIMRK